MPSIATLIAISEIRNLNYTQNNPPFPDHSLFIRLTPASFTNLANLAHLTNSSSSYTILSNQLYYDHNQLVTLVTPLQPNGVGSYQHYQKGAKMNFFTIILLILVVGAVYLVSVYNLFQKLKTQIEASIQEIGNQLKRQASLIPNLESSVKGYMKQEKGIFKMLTDARKSVTQAEESGSAKDINQAIDKIQSLVPQLRVVLESNPEIKSDQTVIKFMNELTDTADKIAYARRSVIDLTQAFNQKLVTFPSNIIANMFGFKKEPGLQTATSGQHLEVSTDELNSPKVDLS